MRCPDVVVTDRSVYFDGQELPWVIAQDGIRFKPGGSDDINTLTIEFFVGGVFFLDSWETEYDKGWSRVRAMTLIGFALMQGRFDKTLKEYSDG